MKKSIRFKLISGLIVIIAIPMLCIFGIIATDIVRISRADYLASSGMALRDASRAIQLFLDEARANMDHLASYPELRDIGAALTDYLSVQGKVPTTPREDDALGQELRQRCVLLQRSHPLYRKVYLGSRHGGFVSSSEAPRGSYDPRTRAWYKDASASPERAVLSAPFRSTDGEATVSAARSFSDASGTVLGVVSADISLSVITDMASAIRPGRTGFVLVAEKNGVVVADTRDPRMALTPLAGLGDPALSGLVSGPAGEVEAVLGGQTFVVNVFDAPELGWRFVSGIGKEELLEPARRTVGVIAWVGLGSLVLIIGCLWAFMDRAMIRPLSRAGSFLRAMGEGRYETRLESLRRGDEIDAMFTALNDMALRLGETIAEARAKSCEAEEKALACQSATAQAEEASVRALRAREEGMLQAANRLEAVVAVVSSASTELSGQVGQAARDSREQAGRAEKTAVAMEEMNAIVLEVAKSAAVAAETSSRAREEAEQGTATMGRVAEAMERVRGGARKTREHMGVLARQAQNIGQVLGIISDIADQTNLLALNAAIEAARAGDAGRGFAVVADEVRKLAEKTMLATREVNDTTRGIQASALESAEAVDHSARAVEETSARAGEAGEVLRRIMEFVDLTADQVRAIATAAEEQSATSEEINRSVGDISTLASATAGVMGRSIHAVQSVGDQVGELSALIAEMQGGVPAEAAA